MNFSEYLVNNRSLTTFLSLDEELNIENNKNYLFDLSYLSSLKITGERAEEFLQGQISCDVHKVSASTIQQGAMCNLKGRVLALFDVLNWQGLQLILASDLLAATEHSLTKSAMLSRVKLEASTDYQIYGFYLSNPKDLLPANTPLPSTPLALNSTELSCCYSLDNQFYILLIKKELNASLIQPFIEHQQFRGSLVWHQLQLACKRIQIYPDTRGLFLPHRIDLHLSGHLSFDKGCYKGQEIVARTHYRATLKYGLKLFTIETSETLTAGKKLFTPDSKAEIGELIDYCPLENNRYIVAVSILFEHPNQVLMESQMDVVSLEPISC
ncbi:MULTISPECIES: YgfZ/GcvT domain-containing protein [Legionella]|uniref:Glycine cleavage T protein n=1 Tax=Legionella drozanskii LLAP-1 TaxID=1212489 RepID=A0A0W0TDN6_9GAMM|nr:MULTISPECIES: glycine cleavage system protein T [Legionella]KTC93724.1 glycine cleavage T protein [Legionella drozanskii LLAP-1]PJE12501.1 MAG: folate-binding protein YgfZ [Legionella sp.]